MDSRFVVKIGVKLHMRVLDVNYKQPFPLKVEVNRGDLPTQYVKTLAQYANVGGWQGANGEHVVQTIRLNSSFPGGFA